jgi:hypothetical protein
MDLRWFGDNQKISAEVLRATLIPVAPTILGKRMLVTPCLVMLCLIHKRHNFGISIIFIPYPYASGAVRLHDAVANLSICLSFVSHPT